MENIKPIEELEFEYINEVYLCGKIISKKYNPKSIELVITVSIDCGNKKRVKNEKGQIIRDLVTVRFMNVPATVYASRFNKGDFVYIRGVAQNIKNAMNRSSHTEIWGLEMNTKSKRARDKNRVHIRGKVDTAKVLSPNYIILNVVTHTDETFVNPVKDSDVKDFARKFRSVTPVGIRCKGDAREVIRAYTPGTWIDNKGFVDVKTREKDNKIHREMRIISVKHRVVGQTQPIKVKL